MNVLKRFDVRLGIYLDGHVVRGVEIKEIRRRKTEVLRTISHFSSMSGDSLARSRTALQEFTNINELAGRHICAAFEGSDLIIRHLRVPQMPDEELKEAISWEIEKHLPLDKEELITDYSILESENGEGSNDYLVLLAAVPYKISWQYAEMFQGCGLKVNALDIASTALYRYCLSLELVGENEAAAVIDLGWESIHLVGISKKRMVFAWSVAGGLNALADVVAEERGLPERDAEKLIFFSSEQISKIEVSQALKEAAEKVKRALAFLSTQVKRVDIDSIYLVGESTKIPVIKDFLVKELGYKVIIPYSHSDHNIDPQYAIAYGLAQRGLYSS